MSNSCVFHCIQLPIYRSTIICMCSSCSYLVYGINPLLIYSGYLQINFNIRAPTIFESITDHSTVTSKLYRVASRVMSLQQSLAGSLQRAPDSLRLFPNSLITPVPSYLASPESRIDSTFCRQCMLVGWY